MPARQDWMDDIEYERICMEEKARLNSLDRYENGKRKALIAIKAQHPLDSDGMPGDEYTERLVEAIRLSRRLTERGLDVAFATFGGIHAGNASVTLAEAGKNYLIQCGGIVDESRIMAFSDVLNGNDEDRSAAEAFDEGDYAELHVVLSLGQLPRAVLSYHSFGWQPFFHPITYLRNTPHHSFAAESCGDWGIRSFFKSQDKVQEVTDQITQRHLDEAKQEQST